MCQKREIESEETGWSSGEGSKSKALTQIVFVKHPFVFLVPNATMETNLGFPYPESEMADAAAFQSFIMEIQQGKMPKIVLLYSRYLMKYSKITNNRTVSFFISVSYGLQKSTILSC